MKVQEMNTVVSALVTPFDRQGRLNESALRDVLRFNRALGVRCVYVCGTTGEGLSLGRDERKRVVEVCRHELRDDEGLLVNISHMEYRAMADLAAHAAAAGADVLSVLPPLFYPVTTDEVTAYLLQVCDEVTLPLTVYNIPALSGRSLDVDTVQRLAERPGFVGIKHTSEDFVALNRFKQIRDGRLLIWSGRDAYYLSGLAMGADGAIGSSFTLMGDLFLRITAAFRAGDLAAARRLQEAANGVHRRLQAYGAIQSIKRCLTLAGIDAGDCRLPFQPLPAENDGYFRDTLAQLQACRQAAGA